MAIKRSVNTTNNPSQGPRFNFKTYSSADAPFHNNETDVDFVTYNGSLYVCVNDGTSFRSGDPANNGFLLLVQKGEDGRDGVPGRQGPAGPEPDYQLRFNGKQLIISDEHGVRKAVSPDLTGPVWFPELVDGYIRWTRKTYDDGSVPEDINLEDLRPVEEHPVLFRLNSDNAKRSDEESGPGYYIQWKKEGQEEWTNLMSISELMNIALAGVSFWDDPNDGKIHFGHRQVLKATYDSEKLGNTRIAEVELGEVLFDAGSVPYPGHLDELQDEMDALQVFLCDIQTQLENLDLDGIVRSVNSKVPDSNGNVLLTSDDIPGLANAITSISGDQPDVDGNYMLSHLNFDLKIEDGKLWLDYNNEGDWKQVGDVGVSSSEVLSDALTNVSISGNVLTFTKGSNQSIQITLPQQPTVNVTANYSTGTKIATVGGTDIYVPSGIGTTVAVNPIQQSGTKIATITVNGNGTDLYAPNGGGNNGDNSNCVTNIDFQVSSGRLQYRLYKNGAWSDWANGPQLPSGGSADLSQLRLRIYEGYLQISRDGGNTWDTPGMQLPSGSGGGLTQQEVQNLIDNSLLDYLTLTIADNRYMLKSELQGVEYYRTFQLFQRTNSTTTSPTKPNKNTTNIKWDTQNQTLINIPNGYAWTQSPENATTNTPYLWMTCATFRSVDGTIIGDWQDPVCMTGENGKDGEDGEGIKFIFKLASDAQHVPSAPQGQAPAFDNSWSDDAQGIDTTWRAEFYCYATRSISNNTTTWSTWQGPYLWSSYGEDGVDGAGIEYIYYATNSSSLSSDQKPSNLANSVITGSTYQNRSSEFVPKASDNLPLTGGGTLSVDWTDNPTGVSNNLRYEFVSCRKFRYASANATEKTWGPFSEPTVWAHFGQDGNSIASNDVIVPTSTSVVATNPQTNGNVTTYNISGTVQWRLSHNGSAVSGDYCTVHLGSSANGTSIFNGTTNNQGLYSAEIPANTTSSNLFLHIVWHEGSTVSGTILDTALVPIIVQGPKGDPGTSTVQGLDGPVMRVRNWQSGVQYYDGNTPVDGISYLDIVLYEGDYYKCISNTNSQCPVSNKNGSTDPDDWTYNTTYWTRFAFLGDAAFRTMLAQNAYIVNLTSKQIVVTDSNNAVVGGMTSSNGVNASIEESANNHHTIGDIRIWAGPLPTNGNLAQAPFTVDHDGVMKATKGYFGDGTDGIWIDGSGVVKFGTKVDIPTSSSQGYTIAVTGSSVLATPVTNNNTTTYTLNGGTVSFALYNNGTKVTTQDSNCKVYLSGNTSNSINPTFSNGNYSAIITGSGLSDNQLFVQIIWYGDSQLSTVRSGVVVPIAAKGEDGAPGSSSVQTINGPIMRLRDWAAGTDYRNGTMFTGETIVYLDVVKVTETVQENGQSVTQINFYKCTSSHQSSSTFATDKATKWTPYSFMGDAAFNSLIANNGYITNLTSKQIVITDGNNTVQGGMTSGKAISVNLDDDQHQFTKTAQAVGNIRIWAGPLDNTGNLSSAPFTVDDQGNVKASGNITANSISCLTINGNNVSSANSLGIMFGNANTAISNPENNTLYFLY